MTGGEPASLTTPWKACSPRRAAVGLSGGLQIRGGRTCGLAGHNCRESRQGAMSAATSSTGPASAPP